jgi:Nuclease A inhibitor-like protein
MPRRIIKKAAPLKKPVKKGPEKIAAKTVKTPVSIGYMAKLCEALERASAGLLAVSESDHGYRFFSLLRQDLYKAGDPLNVQALLSAVGLSEDLTSQFNIPVDKLVEIRTLDGFFPGKQELADFYGVSINDPKVIAEARRYVQLEKLLHRKLEQVTVFRVGQVEIRCYLAGFTRQGSIAGLVTTVIET